MNYTPTQKELADILEHVRYEIEHTFIIPKHDTKDSHIRESVFLAMLIHARLLLDFFEHTYRERDGVMCSDFGFKPQKVPLAPEERKRFNKDMAHLTYSRLRHTSLTKPWPIPGILLPLRDRAASFVSHIVSAPPQMASEDELQRWRVLNEAFTQSIGGT